MSAHSFLVKGGAGAEVLASLGRSLDGARATVRAPSAVLVFVSGGLTRQVRQVAERVRERLPGVAGVVVPAAGVVSDRGEVERDAGAAGLVWSGPRAMVYVGGAGSHPDRIVEHPLGVEEGDAASSSKPPASRVVFVGPEWARQRDAGALVQGGGVAFGAGAVADPIVLTGRGEIVEAPLAALGLCGAAPLLEASGAAKLVSEFWHVDALDERGLVEKLSGVPALDRLATVSQRPGSPRQLVLAAVHRDSLEGRDEPWRLRPIRGLDEGRRALRISGVAAGDRVAFATLDPEAGRKGLDRAARALAAAIRGAAPDFALLLTCAGRGSSFYGGPEAELRIVRNRLPSVPVVGMQSTFELVGSADAASCLALHTAVLALFRSPS